MTNSQDPLTQIALLERLAANTWPAAVDRKLGEWRLRAANGVTRRANSVLAVGKPPEDSDWLREVEDFYAGHGLPARFHISPASPPWLDAALESEGYLDDMHTSLLIADANASRSLPEPEGRFRVMLYKYANEEWLNHFLACEGYEESRRHAYERIFTAIEPNRRFASFEVDGTPAAVGTAVVEGGWAGFMNIAVAESFRRQGVGLQLMKVLIDWACGQGADGLYLQVVKDNEAALRLYAKIGFTHLFDYHYKVKS
ncbi:GNAT family N-acetyltransferase [Paenibacillus contaminans]|uniref:N-acetyltransferase domain-containing protein n=1 Tax=Paenibacillus contaminans TaxID=450362 RepID=A0A329MP99_9BACL|nr:GNAT family N-acetyltransferase [Paenibacillus contaminans]RAV20553.1 hypothetical protein DQG23_13635 [Paenibacillus contaminans]